MYATMISVLAEEHLRNLRAQARADELARQARQARRERRARRGEVRHGITRRRPQAAARHA
jgi:hypothetical protein